jgi:hypothetical protein
MTKMKTILAATALMLAPGLAAAEGCSWMKEQTATMTCAPGTTFDATAGTCVPEATS